MVSILSKLDNPTSPLSSSSIFLLLTTVDAGKRSSLSSSESSIFGISKGTIGASVSV